MVSASSANGRSKFRERVSPRAIENRGKPMAPIYVGHGCVSMSNQHPLPPRYSEREGQGRMPFTSWESPSSPGSETRDWQSKLIHEQWPRPPACSSIESWTPTIQPTRLPKLRTAGQSVVVSCTTMELSPRRGPWCGPPPIDQPRPPPRYEPGEIFRNP